MYKKYIEGKKVVCFDLDGTIVNTEPLFVLAFAKVLEKQTKEVFYGDVFGKVGEPLTEKWRRLSKEGVIDKKANVQELAHDTYQEFLNLLKETPLKPKEGFWQLMFKLKEDLGLKVALATNTVRDVAMKTLQKLEIDDIFDFMIFGDEVRRQKPNPEIYETVAKHFGVKTSEMLIFEDSLVGAEAAAASGASLIVVWDTQVVQRLFPEKTLTFLTDFDGLAESLDYTADEELENLKKRMEIEEADKKAQTNNTPKK